MTTKTGRGLGLAVVALAVAVPGATASATLGDDTNHPAFKGHRIVEGVSIGGVKVGMTKSQAIAVWGKPDRICRRGNPYDPDDRRRMCSYDNAGFTVLPSGEVTTVWISLTKPPIRDPAFNRAYRLAAPKLLPFRTGKKIGLRSTMDAARRAYGIVIPDDPAHRSEHEQTVIVRQPQGCTQFGWNASKPTFTYVDTIEVTAPAWCRKDPAEEDS